MSFFLRIKGLTIPNNQRLEKRQLLFT